MKLNDILDKYFEKKVKLTVKLLKEDENYILIEGNKEALEFLGNFLIAHAKEKDCKIHIGPFSTGKAFFSKKSNKGIYVHRIPCVHGKIK